MGHYGCGMSECRGVDEKPGTVHCRCGYGGERVLAVGADKGGASPMVGETLN